MGQVALAEGHEEADALYARNILCERLDLLMVQKIHILFADLREVVLALDLHRLCLYPVAVLPVGAVCRYLAEVDLRVEVCSERVAMVAAVAV